MSAWLYAHREVIALVAAELCRPGLFPTAPRWAAGRVGVAAAESCSSNYRQLSYQELAFHLSDSASFRAFARLPLHWRPAKSRPARDDQRDRALDGVAISGSIAVYWRSASETKVETGTLLRLDSTVTETLIHEPSDSWLVVCGAMRMMVRLLDAAGGDLPQAPAIAWHRLLTAGGTKRRAQAIDHCRKQPSGHAVSRPDRRRRLDRGAICVPPRPG